MYRINKQRKKTLKGVKSYNGETIETKVKRITTNKEPIKDGAPLIYTNRKDGIQAGFNIRTDRFEVAIEAMDKLHKSTLAKREAKVIPLEGEGNKNDGGPEPAQATDAK